MILNTFDSGFFLALVTMSCACASLSIRTCFKSKCDSVDYSCLWNCFNIKVHRNVGIEGRSYNSVKNDDDDT